MADKRPSYDELSERLAEAEAVLRSIGGPEAASAEAAGPPETGWHGAQEAIRAIMELMSEGAAVLDSRGVVLQCNDPLADLLGQPKERLVGSSFASFVHESDAEKWAAAFGDSANLAALGLQIYVARPGGLSAPVRVTLCHLRPGSERVAFLVASDLEWREHRMRQLARANVQLERQRESLEMEATTDGITGAYSSGALFEVLAAQLASMPRNRNPVSVLVIDIDRFKEVNDTLGHAFGDFVLRALCDRCRDSIRTNDYLIRYGGDEFVVILCQTGGPGARVVADRILASVRSRPFEQGGKSASVTVSMGAATALPSERVSVGDLMKRADAALYHVKAAGRNGFACATDLPPKEPR